MKLRGEKAQLVFSSASSPLIGLFDEKTELVCAPSLLRMSRDKSSPQNTEQCRPIPQVEVGVDDTPQAIAIECTSPQCSEELVTGRL